MFSAVCFLASNNNINETRRATAQTIHIRNTYRTSSQSSSLHNQPLQVDLCNCTTQWLHFPVTLSEHQGHSNWNQSVEFSSVYHYIKFETNQFISIWHTMMLNIYFIKSPLHSSLPWPLLLQNKFRMSFNKPTGCDNILNFIQINSQYLNLWENGHWRVSLNTECTK